MTKEQLQLEMLHKIDPKFETIKPLEFYDIEKTRKEGNSFDFLQVASEENPEGYVGVELETRQETRIPYLRKIKEWLLENHSIDYIEDADDNTTVFVAGDWGLRISVQSFSLWRRRRFRIQNSAIYKRYC